MNGLSQILHAVIVLRPYVFLDFGEYIFYCVDLVGVGWYEEEVDAVVADDAPQTHHFLSGVHLVVDVQQNHVFPLVRLEIFSDGLEK